MDTINCKWPPNAERALQVAVMRFGKKNWSQVGDFLEGNGQTCKRYWERALEPTVKLTFEMNDVKFRKMTNVEQEEDCNSNYKSVHKSTNRFEREAETEFHTKSAANKSEREIEVEKQNPDDVTAQKVEDKIRNYTSYDVVRLERHQRVENILKELQRSADRRNAASTRHFEAILKTRRLFSLRMMNCSHLPREVLKKRFRVSEKKIKCEAEQLLFSWWTSKSCTLEFRPNSMTDSTFQEVVKMFCATSFPLSLKFD